MGEYPPVGDDYHQLRKQLAQGCCELRVREGSDAAFLALLQQPQPVADGCNSEREQSIFGASSLWGLLRQDHQRGGLASNPLRPVELSSS